MNVIPAVRGVHRKYLCRFTNISEMCKSLSVLDVEMLLQLTGIFDQRRVQREGCWVKVSIGAWLRVLSIHVRVLWPAMMRVVDENRCLLLVLKRKCRLESTRSPRYAKPRIDPVRFLRSAPSRPGNPSSMIWKVRAGVYGSIRCRGIWPLFKSLHLPVQFGFLKLSGLKQERRIIDKVSTSYYFVERIS